MDPVLRVNAPAVVGEIIDGEAVIMDLSSGHYFSTQGVGCDIWRGIELGATRSSIVRELAAAYGIDPDVAAQAVANFLGDLTRNNLVVESSVESGAGGSAGSWLDRKSDPFSAPVLNAYTDMEELLLLDPIHDVDQAGWPMPKAPETPST